MTLADIADKKRLIAGITDIEELRGWMMEIKEGTREPFDGEIAMLCQRAKELGL